MLTENLIKLPIMEMFSTIQGEGEFQGVSAFFIRLAGCDVGCVWCDVKESWDAKKHKEFTIEAINNSVTKSNAPIVVVTGGEPLMYNLNSLTETLSQSGKSINLETSGAYPVTGKWDWFCLSPKKFKAPLVENYQFANELKIIIYNKSDFDWAEQHAKLVNKNCKLFLQPEWSKEKEMLPLIIDYIKQYPKWQISLQIHKYLNIP